MEKENVALNTYNHSINLLERKNLIITGVKKIENFDNLHFLLETNMGFVMVKGEQLELIKLDTMAGNISIKVTINSINYLLENTKKNKEDSVFNRLFK